MKPLLDPQELARRNNASAAAHHASAKLLRLRRRLRVNSPLSEKILAAIDRLEAERAVRPTRAVGFFLPKRS